MIEKSHHLVEGCPGLDYCYANATTMDSFEVALQLITTHHCQNKALQCCEMFYPFTFNSEDDLAQALTDGKF